MIEGWSLSVGCGISAYPDAAKGALISVATDDRFSIREIANVYQTIRDALPDNCTSIIKHELHNDLSPFLLVRLLLIGELNGRIPRWRDLEREALS